MGGDGKKAKYSAKVPSERRTGQSSQKASSAIPRWLYSTRFWVTCVVSLAVIGLLISSLYEKHRNSQARVELSKRINEEVLTMLKVGGATFFLTVRKDIADPLEYEKIAKSICVENSSYPVNACIVAIWDDEAKMAKALPMSLDQTRSQLYAWSLGQSLWNCTLFPEMGRDKCFDD